MEDDLHNRMTSLEKRLIALEQEVADLKAAQGAPPPPVAALISSPKPVEAAAMPLSAPQSGAAAIDDSLRIGAIRLDERHPPTGEYRHLDISLFEVRLQRSNWDRIKFKMARFKGHSYLEFRSHPNWPEIFHVWPGTAVDAISKLFHFPEVSPAAAPVLADPRDLALLKALFAHLDMIILGATEGMEAPEEEIKSWREEARTLGRGALQILSNMPTPAEPPAAAKPVAPPAASRPLAPQAAARPVAPSAAFRPRAPIIAPKPLAPPTALKPAAPIVAPKPVTPPPFPKPATSAANEGMEFGRIRLDERAPPTGEYRHLDISVFDAKLKVERWDRIKFKFANFKGKNYLEFRNATGWPQAFHAWPGTEQDAISKVFKIPDPTKSTAPALADPRDLTMLKALLGNLNLIVRAVTTDIDAPNEEIELWREEAVSMAAQTLRLL